MAYNVVWDVPANGEMTRFYWKGTVSFFRWSRDAKHAHCYAQIPYAQKAMRTAERWQAKRGSAAGVIKMVAVT